MDAVHYLARRFIKRVKDSPEFQPILPDGFLPEARRFYYDVAQSPDRSDTPRAFAPSRSVTASATGTL